MPRLSFFRDLESGALRRFSYLKCPSVNALQALAAAALCLAWLLPNHYPPWNSFQSESVVAIGLLLFAFGTLGKRRQAGAPPTAWVVMVVAAIPPLQRAAGQLAFSGDAFVSSLYLLGLATAVCVGFTAASSRAVGFSALLATATLAAALASSTITAAQCLDIQGGTWRADIAFGSRGIGNLGQPNNLATLIGLGATGLWLLYEQHRVRSAPAIAALSMLLIGSTLTQSRTALLFGPALLLLRLAIRQRTTPWRVPPGIVIGAIAVQWVLALSWPTVRHVTGLDAPDSLSQIVLQSGRTAVWPVLIDGALQKPWFGYGWLQTGAAQLAVAERHPQVDELFLQAHNIFLDLVIWCGVPLGLLLSALIVVWFVNRVRDTVDREAAIGLMGIALFGVHSLLEFPQQYAYFLLPIGLWVGVIEARRGAPTIGSHWMPKALAVGAAALAIAVAWDYPAVEEDFRLVRFETLSIGPLRATQPAPDAPFLSSLTAYTRFIRTPITANMPAGTFAHMDAVVRRYPYSTVLYRYAKGLALNGQLPLALQMMTKLRHIHGEPRYQRLRATLHEEIVGGDKGLATFAAALPR